MTKLTSIDDCLTTAWQLHESCLTAALWLPDNYRCLTHKNRRKNYLFFLVAGFPVPYIGILTDKGSISSTISPILDYKYHKNIISLKKLPTPGSGSDCVELSGYHSHYLWPGLVPYYENNEIIFLYPNANNLAVKYSITQSSHRKIQKSSLPMGYTFEISNTRLGNHIWIMGGPFCFHDCSAFPSMLWSIKKEKWYFGPKLPQEYSQRMY